MKKFFMFSAAVLFALPSFCAEPIVVKIVPKTPVIKVSTAAAPAVAPAASAVLRPAAAPVKKEAAAKPKIAAKPISFNFKSGPVVGKEYISFMDGKYNLKDVTKTGEGWINEYYLDKETKQGYTSKLVAFEEIKLSKTAAKAAAEKYIRDVLTENKNSQCLLRMRSDKDSSVVADCLVKPKKGASYYTAKKYTSENNKVYYVEYISNIKDAPSDIEKVKPSRESVIQSLFLIGPVPMDKGEEKAPVKK